MSVLAQHGKPDTSLTPRTIDAGAMTWRKTCPMEQRLDFVLKWRSRAFTKTALCRAYGISRQTGYKWANRFAETHNVEELSRRPKSHPATTPTKLVKLILSQKRQFPL